MDGVIVAYHNTEQMFGFQYIPIQEIDECLFGPYEGVGDRVFNKCVRVLEEVSEAIVGLFPGEVLWLHLSVILAKDTMIVLAMHL